MSEEMKENRNSEFGMRNEAEEARNAERGTRSGEVSDFRLPTSGFELGLSSLVPRASGIDRDRLMFLAGQAEEARNAERGVRSEEVEARATFASNAGQNRAGLAWPAAFAAMTTVAASLLVVLMNRPEPQVVERIVRVPVEVPRAALAAEPQEQGSGVEESAPAVARAWNGPAGGDSYLRLREQALAYGLDASMYSLQRPANASVEPPTSYRELRDSLLQ